MPAPAGTTVTRAELGSFLGIGEGLDDFILATDAYIFGYPLVTMEMTRRIITNVAEPVGTRGPMGQIIKLREYPNSSFRDVTAPNADTLYTTSFFDVGKEPWVLSIPDMKGRYFLCPMLDGWTTVFQAPGKRTDRHGCADLRDHWPRMEGHVARRGEGIQIADEHRVAARSYLLHRHARGLCRSSQVAGRVQAGAAQFIRQGLHAACRHRRSSIDMKTAVREQVNKMDAVAYFTLLCKLMKDNPPAALDAPELARFAKIGILPGQDFDASKLKLRDFLKRVPEVAFDRIMLQFKVNKAVQNINGFVFTTKTGIYGTDYLMRAFITAIGLGANRPQDAVYPTSTKDGEKKRHTTARTNM